MGERFLTFWHCAGDIIWRADRRPAPIDAAMASSLRDLYAEEARAAFIARDLRAAKAAASLYRELTDALDALDRWRRIVGAAPRAPWPFVSVGEAVGRVIDGLPGGAA